MGAEEGPEIQCKCLHPELKELPGAVTSPANRAALAETMGRSPHCSAPLPKLGLLTAPAWPLSFSNRCIPHCSVTWPWISVHSPQMPLNAPAPTFQSLLSTPSNWDQKRGHVNYIKSLVWNLKEMILPKNAPTPQSINSLTSGSWIGWSGQKSVWHGSSIIYLKVGKVRTPSLTTKALVPEAGGSTGEAATVSRQCLQSSTGWAAAWDPPLWALEVGKVLKCLVPQFAHL